MSTVTMTHPDLDQTIEVREDAVPHYQASGWEPAENPPARRKKAPARRRQTGDES
ncbi:hypothetical protein ACIQPR_18185 [Streptomyces sp. NPDC091280]|uniref:hypothetical protein n=1 Tax=Streptomyces sp. NPDC091280 TaxID=3365984 RepID=UPI0037FBF272